MAIPEPLQKIGTETQQSRVFQEIARALLFGAFAPGEPISVKMLCDQLGAGTMPVRESIARLVGLGALDAYPNRNLRVPVFAREEFDELCDVREALEGLAAARAARFAGHTAIATMRAELALLDEAVAAADIEGALTHNVRFHFTLYEQARSRHVLPFVEAIWLRLGPLLRVPFATATAPRDQFLASHDVHHELIAAVERHDPARARRAMRSILRRSANWYRRNYVFAESDETAPASRRWPLLTGALLRP